MIHIYTGFTYSDQEPYVVSLDLYTLGSEGNVFFSGNGVWLWLRGREGVVIPDSRAINKGPFREAVLRFHQRQFPVPAPTDYFMLVVWEVCKHLCTHAGH